MFSNDLIINWHTMMMVARSGDSAADYFRIVEPLGTGVFIFTVKENAEQTDEEAVLKKEFPYSNEPHLFISLDSTDTSKLSGISAKGGSYRDYIWGLKFIETSIDEHGMLVRTGKAKTIVPRYTKKPPVFRVYPGIIGES